MESKRVIEKALQNKVVLINWNSIMALLMISYLSEMIQGHRKWWYLLIMFGIGYVPVLIGFLLYKKDKETPVLKYFVTYSYVLIYVFVLFTGNPLLTYVYIFPVFCNIMVYSNPGLLMGSVILYGGVNLVNVVYNAFLINNPNLELKDYAVQLSAILLVMGFGYFVSRVQNKINMDKLRQLNEDKEKESRILREVVKSAEDITEQVSNLNQEAIIIAENASGSNTAIMEISNGTSDMVNQIQKQLEDSNMITSLVATATQESHEIQQRFVKTRDNTEKGMENMEELSKASSDSKKTNEMVDRTMQLLNEKTTEVRGIISIINGITNQTHLLSLNAAIEAARAGESGKGFAVVADEISKLASDTQAATENINRILADLTQEAESATQAVSVMNSVNQQQSELINETISQFSVIQKDISEMNERITNQSEGMEEIQELNNRISQTVEFLSAFSEELMANTESTKGSMETTTEGCGKVSEMLTKTSVALGNLKKITQ